MRPTGSPSRHARKYSASACSKYGFLARSRNWRRSMVSGGTHGVPGCRPRGSLMKLVSSPRPCTGRTSTAPDTVGTLSPAPSPRRPDPQRTGIPGTLPGMDSTQTPVDVFEKARTHERLEQLEAAKQGDLLPYFRILESQAGPVVDMEGRETIMLGSNNYLGLTTDPRVKQAARDALETYGTGVTGSRLLNGTTPLHLDLERELAEWMRAEDAIVFATGYQSNLGAISAILEPGDTVICDSGDHASILDGCKLSGARLLRGIHRRPDRGHRVHADLLARLHLQRLRRPRGRGSGPGGAAHHPLGGAAAVRTAARQRRLPPQRVPRARPQGGRAGDPPEWDGSHHPRRPGDGRRGLAGRPALEGPLRRRRLHQRRDPSGGAAGRGAAADEPDGDSRARTP